MSVFKASVTTLCPFNIWTKKLGARGEGFLGQVILLLCKVTLAVGSRCWLHSEGDKVDLDAVGSSLGVLQAEVLWQGRCML